MNPGRKQLLAILQVSSGREVAARCKTAPGTVSKWASGKATPSPSAQAKLAAHCRVDGPWPNEPSAVCRRQ